MVLNLRTTPYRQNLRTSSKELKIIGQKLLNAAFAQPKPAHLALWVSAACLVRAFPHLAGVVLAILVTWLLLLAGGALLLCYGAMIPTFFARKWTWGEAALARLEPVFLETFQLVLLPLLFTTLIQTSATAIVGR